MIYNDDKLFKQLRATYEVAQLSPEDQIENRLKLLARKVQMQFKKYKNARIHNSYVPITKESFTKVQQPVLEKKPEGIWYGFGDSWIKDVILEIPEWLGTYGYILEVDSSKLKNISKFAMDLFIQEYGDEDNPKMYMWDIMSRKYMGVETQDMSVINKVLFSWETISGCIWDPTCITSIKEIDIGLTDEEKEFVRTHGRKLQAKI
jgi:hypothetical protein